MNWQALFSSALRSVSCRPRFLRHESISDGPAPEAKLLGCDLIVLFEGPDQVAAVCEAGLSSNIVQVVVREQQEILHLAQPDELNILLAALPIIFQEHLCKIRVAHIIMVSQFFYINILLRMAVNINQDILDPGFFCLR